ncbi:MAG TPA: hypothetical protein ENN61_02345 [Bacteroidaceae bacterium]|nr:hypothetical protein [Bacteroidaceae bacterium]
MFRNLTYCLGILLLWNFSACRNDSPDHSEIILTENHEIKGVSVWDRISARDQPLRNSSRVSLLSLGESFLYLDTFAIDSSYNNTKFLKVRLSDSSVVWVYDFASVLDAKPAVIITEVPLYLRPDLLTITDERLKIMEIVAVVEEWDEWIKVVNEKKENRGWIKKENITTNTIDLAFALLVKRNVNVEDQEQKVQNLEVLLENNPYPNTVFLTDLRNIVEHEKELLREIRQDYDREDWDRRKRNR